MLLACCSARGAFIKCYHGADEGLLFPTKHGLLFGPKPLLFLGHDDVDGIDVSRGGVSFRTFDLNVGVRPTSSDSGAGAKKKAKSVEFRMLPQEELEPLKKYVTQCAFNASSGNDSAAAAPAESSKPSVTAEAKAEEVQATPAGDAGDVDADEDDDDNVLLTELPKRSSRAASGPAVVASDDDDDDSDDDDESFNSGSDDEDGSGDESDYSGNHSIVVSDFDKSDGGADSSSDEDEDDAGSGDDDDDGAAGKGDEVDDKDDDDDEDEDAPVYQAVAKKQKVDDTA